VRFAGVGDREMARYIAAGWWTYEMLRRLTGASFERLLRFFRRLSKQFELCVFGLSSNSIKANGIEVSSKLYDRDRLDRK
jgi:hypothetical protein